MSYPFASRALMASWWLVCVVSPMMGHRLPRVQFMYMMRSNPVKRVMLAAAGSVMRSLSAGHVMLKGRVACGKNAKGHPSRSSGHGRCTRAGLPAQHTLPSIGF